jgi:D-aminopeptidase
VFAGAHRLNGNGELTGLEWHAAIVSAGDAAVAEGGVGSGTGMICHGFKGGIGTASRVLTVQDGGFTVGVLVQANHGRRERLAVNGAPVGRELGADEISLPVPPEADLAPGFGSIIIVVATDAPLLPHQCARLAQRAGLGVARTGGAGEHTSGDLFLCFAIGNRGMTPGELGHDSPLTVPLTMLSDAFITGLFYSVIEATEEAILNAMLSAETMTGRDGITAHALPAERVAAIVNRWTSR